MYAKVGSESRWLSPGSGESFRDEGCPGNGPEMLPVPAGTFVIGSPENESGRLDVEGPQRTVTISEPFAVGKFAVTVDEFLAFMTDSGYQHTTHGGQWNGTEFADGPFSMSALASQQKGNYPAVCVNWHDAQAYAAWLSSKTGHHYRLLTEAEWEYAARAGTTTPFWWGDSVTPDQANFNASTTYGPSGRTGPWRQETVPVDSFAPNPWGLYQVHGNIWEWVQDCYKPTHADAADDSGKQTEQEDCEKRVLRGGSWLNNPRGVRSARRHAASPDFRRSDVGFRLARMLSAVSR